MMRNTPRFASTWVFVVLFGGMIAAWMVSCSDSAETSGTQATMPPAPKVSTFAPAEDLSQQVDLYVKELEKVVADAEEYKDGQDKIANDSNTLVILALALGLHDGESKYKPQAAAIMKAAEAVAAAKDFAAAQKAVAAVRDAVEGKTKAEGELRWVKVASLPELMKQVPNIDTKLKRYAKGPKFKAKARETAGYSATIAAIAQGTMADTSAAKNPEQVKQWYVFSAAMRDAAGSVNAAIHKLDESATDAAMQKLAQSCEDCHAVFKPKQEAAK